MKRAFLCCWLFSMHTTHLKVYVVYSRMCKDEQPQFYWLCYFFSRTPTLKMKTGWNTLTDCGPASSRLSPCSSANLSSPTYPLTTTGPSPSSPSPSSSSSSSWPSSSWWTCSTAWPSPTLASCSPRPRSSASSQGLQQHCERFIAVEITILFISE